MNRTETGKFLAAIVGAYGSRRFTIEPPADERSDSPTVATWSAQLADVDAGAAAAALAAHIGESEFPPAPADILKRLTTSSGREADREAQRFIFNRWDPETDRFRRLADPVPFNHLEPGSYERAIERAFAVGFRQ